MRVVANYDEKLLISSTIEVNGQFKLADLHLLPTPKEPNNTQNDDILQIYFGSWITPFCIFSINNKKSQVSKKTKTPLGNHLFIGF